MGPKPRDAIPDGSFLVSWNSNGNPSKKTLFSKMINDVTNRNRIVVINDCRLQRGEEHQIRARYHNVEIANKPERGHNAGGVAILVPKGSFMETHTDGNKEQLVVSITIQGVRINLATQYVHPGETIDANIVEKLDEVSGNDVGILIGDLNSSHTEYGGHSDTMGGRVLKQVVDDNNLMYVPNQQITHFASRPGDRDNVIDVAFVNHKGESLLVDYGVMDSWGSDHLPLFVEFKFRLKNDPIKAYITDEEEYKANQRRMNYEWKTGALNKTDIDEHIKKFEEVIVKCKSDASHTKEIKTNGGIALSVETTELIKERRKLERQRRNKNRIFTETQRQRSNWLNREIKRSIETDKRSYQTRQGSRIIYENNAKKRWEMINNITGRKQRDENFKALIKPDGSKTKNIEENVELHADRLQKTCSLAPDPRMDEEWRRKVDAETEQRKEVFEPSAWVELEDLEDGDVRKEMIVTKQELVDMIKAAKPKGAGGPDMIDHWMMKRFTNNTLDQLVRILNACIIITYFPTRWKEAHTCMLPKPGKDGSFSENYRPISLCSVLGKLLEKMYLRAFNKFTLDNNLQRERQCGFKRGRSAQESLLKLAEDCATAFKTKKEVLGVFVDLEKAFDRLYHRGLIYKLIQDNAPLGLTRIIASFLQDRTFRIKEKGTLSTPRPLEASAPQGGVGSPPLFSYYLFDMPGSDHATLASAWSDGSAYADDNAEWRAFANLLIATQELQRYLDRLEEWGSKWRLLPSPTKTEVIIFSRATNGSRVKPKLYLFGQELKVVEQVKFLGTIFDRRLTWQPHLSYLTSKAIPRSFQIAKISQCLNGRNPELILDLINSLVTSLYDYASVVFAPMAETHWNLVHNVHMRMLKSAAGVPRRTPDRVIFDTVNTPPMRETIMKRAQRRFENINRDNPALSKYQKRHAEMAWKRPTNKSPYDVFKPVYRTYDCYHCLFENNHFCVPLPNPATDHG